MALRHRLILSLALVASLAAGCSNQERASAPEAAKQLNEAPGGNAVGAGADELARRDAPQAPAGKPQAAQAPAEPQAPEAAQSRYIIRRAQLGLEVANVRQSMDRIGAIARAAGGFVSDADLQANEGQPPSASLTLRVPARRFDGLLDQVGGIGTVRTKQVTGEDVTVEFVDTQARVRNLQRQEAQLLKLLDRSGKLSDVLEVERELARVRGEIEQAQARVRHLGALVELSTIEVALAEKRQVANASPWQLPAVWENAWQNAQRRLADATAELVSGFVWLVGFVLPLLVPALVLYLLVGWWLRKALTPRTLSPTRFNQLWLALGIGVVGLAYPPLFGFVLIVGLIALVLWLASSAWVRFARRREEA